MNKSRKLITIAVLNSFLFAFSLFAADLDLDALKKKLPETITPLTADQLETKEPQSYYFDYLGEPQPGTRKWSRIDKETWQEVYPDGLKSIYKVLGHAEVGDMEGTIVVKVNGDEEKTTTTNDGGLQAFIPDKGSKTMHHWYRNTARGDTEWNDLADMQDVKFVSAASSVLAADSPVHWYRFTIVAGSNTSTYTGSSALTSEQIAAKVEAGSVILLENQRDAVQRPGETAARMQAVDEDEKLFIVGRTVVYFSELPKDPAVSKK